MVLKVLGSNSFGNCYILQGGNSTLILECGIDFNSVKKALNFDFSKVAGALLTHEHGDHSKYIKKFTNQGIDIYCSEGTKSKVTNPGHRIKSVKSKVPFKVGEFNVIPFDVMHDAAEPFGFLINHHECGTVLFLTDSYYSPYKFNGLNHVIVEANYCEDILWNRTLGGTINHHLKDRIITSHLSIQTCLKLLNDNDLSNVRNIVLIHLSDGNSNEKEFKQKVIDATGKSVYVASKGDSIPFNINPF